MSELRKQLAYMEELQTLRASAEGHVSTLEEERFSSLGLPFSSGELEEKCQEYLDQVREWQAILSAPAIGVIGVSRAVSAETEQEASR